MKLHQKIILVRGKLQWLASHLHNVNIQTEYNENFLTSIKKEVISILDKMDDPNLCPSNCKGMYFCELNKKHFGFHKEGGLVWSDEEAS